MDKRVISDCRKYPGSTCSLTIAGTEEEVLPLAKYHAVKAHGEQDSPELEEKIKAGLEEEK